MKLSLIVRLPFFLTIVILVLFGVGSLLSLSISESPNRSVLYTFYALTMFGDAAILLFCVWQLTKRKKWIYYLSVLVFSLNIFATIFDQFGLVDLLFALLNLVTLVFLIIARKEFLPA